MRKLIDRLVSVLKRPAFHSLGIPLVVSAAVAASVSLLSAFNLPPEERGTLAFVLDSSYLLAGALLVGTPRATILCSKGSESRQFNIVASLLRPLILISSVGLTTALIGSFFWPTPAIQHFIIIFALVLSQGIAVGVQLVATTRESPKPPWAVLANQAMLFILIVAIAFLGYEDGLAWALAYLFSSLPLAWVMLKRLRFLKSKSAFPDLNTELHRIRKLGLELFPFEMITIGLQRLDRVLIGLVLGLPALGVYVVAAQVFEISRGIVVYWLDTRLPGPASSKQITQLIGVRNITSKFTTIAVPTAMGLGLLALSLLAAIGNTIEVTMVSIVGLLAVSFYLDGIWRILQHVLIKSENANHLWKTPAITGVLYSLILLGLLPVVGLVGAPLARLIALSFAVLSDWLVLRNLRRS